MLALRALPLRLPRATVATPCRARLWCIPLSATRAFTTARSLAPTVRTAHRTFSWTPRTLDSPKPPAPSDAKPAEARENIYTLPNALTLSRIAACPVIGWALLHDHFYLSTGLLAYAALSDAADGWLARRFDMRSVLGTVLDPAADKTLMTTLTVTLALKGLLPGPPASFPESLLRH
jgi:cardiolipin synthase